MKQDFETVVREEMAWLSAYVRRKLSHSAWEDLVQEIFIKAFRAYDDYEETGKRRGWLARIADNTMKNYFTRQAPMPTLSLDLPDEDGDTLFYLAKDIFRELYAADTDKDHFQAKSYAAILNLTTLISQNMKENLPCDFDNIQTAVEYINHHITEDLKIDQICASCYLSKYHFCRLFKEKIGLTVMDYILKTRVTMAKELLWEADLSVTEISESCGFSSISYFSRAFKNETGVSPLQYKKRKTEKIF